MTTSPEPPTPSETQSTPTAAPTASPEQSAYVGRRLITIALIFGTLGLAIPFGSASGPLSQAINPLEWVVSALGLIAAVGLCLDLAHPWRTVLWRTGFAELATGFLWASSSFYELILPGEASLQWRIAHALMYSGYAILALSAWRWINRGNTRGRAAS